MWEKNITAREVVRNKLIKQGLMLDELEVEYKNIYLNRRRNNDDKCLLLLDKWIYQAMAEIKKLEKELKTMNE